MSFIVLPREDVLGYVSDIISDIKYSGSEISNAKYHHNTDYKNASSICKHGILTLEDLNSYGIRNDSEEFLKIMGDTESHVNGNNSVSLSITGLDDLYRDEEEYNPFAPHLVDFLVCSSLKTSRSSVHYGNEFLSFQSINKEKLKSVDVRLLRFIKLNELYADCSAILSVVEKYNYLRGVAFEMKKQSLDIPLREMSEDSVFELDIDRLAYHPKLHLK